MELEAVKARIRNRVLSLRVLAEVRPVALARKVAAHIKEIERSGDCVRAERFARTMLGEGF